jgi:hypothetical protein
MRPGVGLDLVCGFRVGLGREEGFHESGQEPAQGRLILVGVVVGRRGFGGRIGTNLLADPAQTSFLSQDGASQEEEANDAGQE